MTTAIEQAEYIIYADEEKHLRELYAWLDDAKRRAELCGCPNCKKELKGVEERIQKEYSRLIPKDRI